MYGASLSKSLFAVLVMQLVEAGKLNLDKPIYTYLPKPIPEYEDYKDLNTDSRWKLLTARHCLAHTTGFPNWRQFNPKENLPCRQPKEDFGLLSGHPNKP
jgi:CubicO group peptidase (beta-lactamase class C family)